MATVNKNFKVKNGIETGAGPFSIDQSNVFVLGYPSPVVGQIAPGVAQKVQFIADGTDRNIVFQRSEDSPNGSAFYYVKSRGSVASPTIVQSSDTLLHFAASAYDGTQYKPSILIEGRMDGTPGTNIVPSRINFSTFGTTTNSLTQRMTILSSGNVGIGLSSPTNMLDVAGAIGWGSNTGRLTHLSGVAYIDSVTNDTGSLVFRTVTSTAATERMRITNSGNVGIGTSGPARKLQIVTNGTGIDGLTVSTNTANLGSINLLPSVPASSYSGIVQSGDSIILFGNIGTQNSGALSITPWNSRSFGIRIDGSNGNVGIGKSIPEYALDVSGSIKGSSGVIDQAMYFASAGSILNNLPIKVNPAEQLLKEAVWWIDASHQSANQQIIENLGWGGPSLNAQLGSTSEEDSNDPKYLPWEGDNYVYLSGVAGNFMSTPDSPELDITGDIDIRARIALDDWTPSNVQPIVDKYSVANNQSYLMWIDTSGFITLYWTEDGVTGKTFTSSAAAAASRTVSDNGELWVRATLDVDNGASGHTVTFYTSLNGSLWNQLGSVRTGTGTTSIFSGTSPLRIGSYGGAMLSGKIFRIQILTGINGTPVIDIDSSLIESGSVTSFKARTGQIISILRSTSERKSACILNPCWLFGSDDYMEVPNNSMIDFGSTDSFTVMAIVRQWQTSSTDSIIRKGNFSDSSYGIFFNSDGSLWSSVRDTTTSVDRFINITLGKVITAFQTINRSTQTQTLSISGSSSSTSISTIGSLQNSSPLRIGISPNASNAADVEIISVAIFRRALSTDEISLLNSYYSARVV